LKNQNELEKYGEGKFESLYLLKNGGYKCHVLLQNMVV